MANNPIQLITFDLDNTLWAVDAVIMAADREMRDWLQEQSPGFNDAFSGERMLAMRTKLIAAQPQLQHDISAMRVALLTQALQQFGYEQPQARAIAQGAFDVFMVGRHKVQYYPGIPELLARLAQRFTLAALSNGNADIQRLSVQTHFSFSYSAASVGASKPHPAMFEAALAHANVDPHQAIHIGDHPVDDIQGASAVGMHTVWLDQDDQQHLSETMPANTERATTVAQIEHAVARVLESHS